MAIWRSWEMGRLRRGSSSLGGCIVSGSLLLTVAAASHCVQVCTPSDLLLCSSDSTGKQPALSHGDGQATSLSSFMALGSSDLSMSSLLNLRRFGSHPPLGRGSSGRCICFSSIIGAGVFNSSLPLCPELIRRQFTKGASCRPASPDLVAMRELEVGTDPCRHGQLPSVSPLILRSRGFGHVCSRASHSCDCESGRTRLSKGSNITDEDAKLPCTLACFSVFLLGEIFSQDPLGASDKALTSSGPYMIEEDATVYRRPYLVSGSSGFALNAIKRAIGKDLKVYTESMRSILASDSWNAKTTICWGLRDRWLSYDGVEYFCRGLKHKFVELPMAGHHVQEDHGEELGNIIKRILSG